jgi:hypothetical protein
MYLYKYAHTIQTALGFQWFNWGLPLSNVTSLRGWFLAYQGKLLSFFSTNEVTSESTFVHACGVPFLTNCPIYWVCLWIWLSSAISNWFTWSSFRSDATPMGGGGGSSPKRICLKFPKVNYKYENIKNGIGGFIGNKKSDFLLRCNVLLLFAIRWL